MKAQYHITKGVSAMRFDLSEFATSFATRAMATQILDQIRERLAPRGELQELTVDLSGVRAITPSFATAFIYGLHRLANQRRYKVTGVNIVSTDPLMTARVRSVLDTHLEGTNSKVLVA